MKNDVRIVFMGTPNFAVGVLQKLLEEDKNIVGVITAPDKPAGRGRKLQPSAVKKYALSKDIPILQPTNLKNTDFLAELKALNANLQIIVAFRMLPKVVWAMPALGTFNLHASLLPEYRGAAPINWAIINGEKKTGVTTFFIDEKIDTGEIIASTEVPIHERETVGSLHDTLMKIGSDLVVSTVSNIETGTITRVPQPKDIEFKEAPKLHPENTRIDWLAAPKKIDALIRGLSPYPVAWTKLNNNGEVLKMKIYEATYIMEGHFYQVGAVITSKKELKVAVRGGFIAIGVLQLPGKRKMEVQSLLNGYHFDEDAKVS